MIVLFLLALQTGDSTRLTVGQAVERALASHPTVGVARAMRDRSVADLADARAAQRPRFSVDAALNQYQEPTIVKPLHGFDPTNPPLFDRSLVQGGVSASWTLYDFGVRSSRVRMQDALGGAAAAAMTTTEAQLVARTVTAYARVLTARGVLTAHDQRLAALAATLDRVKQVVAEGKAARVDQLRIETEIQRARADRIGTVAQLEVAEQDLAQLANLPAGSVRRASLTPLQRVDAGVESDTTSASRDALVARAMRSSAEVLEFEQRARAANATLMGARATGMPEVRLSGAYLDRGRLRGDFSAEWQLGMAVSYPLYTGGVRQAAADRASADDRAATDQLRIVRMNVESGIDRTLGSLRESRARVDALASAVDQSAELVRIEQLSLDVGAGTRSEYLDAVANLLRARASLIEAQHAGIVARVELARLVGELSREWIARTVEPRQ
jgi:outer membrane protein